MIDFIAVSLAVAVSMTGSVSQEPALLSEHLRRHYSLSRYQSATADLNGDGRDEAIVLAADRDHCGSGGCALYVLDLRDAGYVEVLHATVARAPVSVLESATQGWKDLVVTVSGGGVPAPYPVRLRFREGRYPANPSILPREPAETLAGGRVLIPVPAG